MAKQLAVKLDVCRDCPDCVISCSYPHHPVNCGVAWLREVAQYELTCRRCEERACVDACPVEALTELDDGRLKRFNMRCIGCESCAHACPFGTLAPGALLFRDTMCDLCEGRVNGAPTCVPTCPYDALSYNDVSADDDPTLCQIEDPKFVVQTARFLKTEPEPAAKIMNINLLHALFYLLVFPGFLFVAVVGMVLSWVDRKVTARVQFRKGPPVLQPLYDVLKLLGKETVVPAGGSRATFLLAPAIGLAGVTLSAAYIGIAAFLPGRVGFSGDLIVVVYLLVLPSLAIILGGAASKNPLASVGASREMKLVLAYELPFILLLLIPIIQSGGQLKLTALLSWQAQNHAFALSISGLIALLLAIPIAQAKLGLVPFDQAEAETEIMAGAFIEYSGPPLALFKLTKMMMLYTVPLFVVVVLMGGFSTAGAAGADGTVALTFTAGSVIAGIGKFLLLIVLAVVIRNTNPRLRIQHAVKFFWGLWSPIAAVCVALALLGVWRGWGWL